jgi:glycopeptide antibiotics resistance protein
LFTAQHYRWLALIYAVVTVFASLVPLEYQPQTTEEVSRKLAKVREDGIQFESMSDWVTNVVLFIPLGYLLAAAFAVDRPGAGPLVAVVVMALCALLSASIEFTQLFFPPRVTSLNDVVAETAGGTIGALMWLLLGQQLTQWARRDEWGLGGGVFPVELLPCCLLALTLIQLLPLHLSIEPGELYRKYKGGHVRIASFIPWPGAAAVAFRELQNIFLFLPIGVLLSGLNPRRWGQWTHWSWVLGVALLLVGAIKFIQFFELFSNSYLSDVILYALAILLGWALGVTARMFSTSRGTPAYRGARRPRRELVIAALMAWLVAVAFLNWYPEAQGGLVEEDALERLSKISLIPFLDYWEGDYFKSLELFVKRLALYVPVGLLLPLALGWEPKKSMTICVISLVVVWAVVVEIGQAFVPGRLPSVTDVLVESIGAWFGYLCVMRLTLGSPTTNASMPTW